MYLHTKLHAAQCIISSAHHRVIIMCVFSRRRAPVPRPFPSSFTPRQYSSACTHNVDCALVLFSPRPARLIRVKRPRAPGREKSNFVFRGNNNTYVYRFLRAFSCTRAGRQTIFGFFFLILQKAYLSPPPTTRD